MIRFRPLLSICCALVPGAGLSIAQDEEKESEEPPPIRALMVTGGCCHDYETQKAILSAGIKERVARKIEWVIVHQGQGESDVKIPLFEDADWAEDYDIVVHNYCFTRVGDVDYVDRILAPHRAGKPAVLIHGAMHSFRPTGDKWFEFCGVSSPGHGTHHPFEVEPVDAGSPILGATDHWTTPKGELYFVEKVWPGATPIAEAVSEDTGESEAVAWTHRFGQEKARVFGTTVGNFNETMIESRYLDMVARGFLWALDELDEENFIERSPDESLKSITLEPETPGLPGPGRNVVTDGIASAMSESDEADEKAGAASDGKVSTLWRAGSAGPTYWKVSLEDSEPIGAIALIWSEDPPPVYVVEGSNDLLDWQQLAGRSDGQRAAQIAIHETEGEFSHLRVTVGRTRPGQIVGLREFAAYRETSDVPAAIKLAAEAPERQLAEPFDLTGESEFLPEGVKLQEDLQVAAVADLPPGFLVKQLVPTASGAVFALVAAEDKSSAGVVLVSQEADGTLTTANFLGGLDPETAIGWDGEWVYTLERGNLTAYRDTDRNGLADERFRHGAVFTFSEEDSTARIRFTDMRSALDGRFYAVIDSADPVSVFRKDGALVELPRHGIASFTREGHGLDVELRAGDEIARIHGDAIDGFYFQRGGSSNRPFLSDIRGVASLAGIPLGFSESDSGELLGIDGKGDFWIRGDEKIAKLSKNGESTPVAVFPSLRKVEASTLGHLWGVYRDESRGGEAIAMFTDTGEEIEGEDMDLQRQTNLIDLLGSRSSVIRREARYEVLRRRRFPQSRLLAVLTDSDFPEARVAAMSALNEAAGDIFIPHLAKLAKDPEPLVRAAAFRAIGRYDVTRNHGVFGAISRETRPEVTAAILGAILRTGTDAPGIDALVLQFAASENRTLAAAAEAFLIRREAADVCFAALDDETRKPLWPVAFSVLEAMERQSIVEGIALRLEQTRSPEMRRLALESLIDIYYRDPVDRTVWEGTKIADLMLRASIADHRVDRAFLLDGMMSRDIPIKDTVELVRLGRENLPLEGAVIELLLEREAPIYAEGWLLEVARDPDRDGDLRLSALALLGSIKSPPMLREIFPLLANRDELDALPETKVMALNRWIKNPAHLANVDWMIARARRGDTQEALLAWHTLLSVIDDPGLEGGAVERAEAAMRETISGSEEKAMSLLDALADSAYSNKEEILDHASSSENLRVKKTAIALATGTDVPVADELLADIEDEEIVARALQLEGDPGLGKSVFNRLSCGDCHNIHGEGPALAPDLASRVRDQSPESLAVAILDPDKDVVDGYATTRYVLDDGTEIQGHPGGTTGEAIALLDSAGNAVDFAENRIVDQSVTGDSIMRDDLTRDLTIDEFASLLRYVKSLAGDQ